MLTDWLLIERLARELEQRLRGARVEDAGLLADRRVALLFRRGAARTLLAVDLFVSPPLTTLEEGELGIFEEPGYVRAFARSLKGMRLAGVAARRFDRLLRLSFVARSRFGVGETLELYVELVPRFGNIVLVKNDTIVAARKEFSPAENPRRAIVAGAVYQLPPLPARTSTIGSPPPQEGAAIDEPLYVYRRAGRLAQAYVAPLDGFPDAERSRAPSLLELFAELRAQQLTAAGSELGVRRRAALLKRLSERERKLRAELAAIADKRRSAGERSALRAQGEEIFATLHTLDEVATPAAKERAAELFAKYKKLGKSLPHIAAREREVLAALDVIEALRWEAERAGAEELDDVDAAVAQLDRRRRQQPPAQVRKRKRRTLELRTARGSRILIGRSPLENAELTFHVARPNDLWFHARGIPGAHVILSREDRAAVPGEDLEIAASLAAFYSRAQGAASVPVDYTLRKHVRKQRAAPPGLVWYAQATTIVAQPTSLDAAALAQEDTAG